MEAPERGATRRARQAAQTRQEILAAARRLFAAQGYARTTLADIASAAGTSVQTIYDSVGSKATLVAALNDLIDDEGDVRTLAARIPSETDPRRTVDIAVSITHNICHRCGDIVGAVYSGADSEPALAAVRDESRRRHREGITRLTRRLDELHALRSGLDVAQAADAISVLTDPQVARTFVVSYGWEWDTWHAWTVEALSTLLLAEPSTSPKRQRLRRPPRRTIEGRADG